MLLTQKHGAAERGRTLIPTRCSRFVCNMCMLLPSLLESICRTSLLTVKHGNREFEKFNLAMFLLSLFIELSCSNCSSYTDSKEKLYIVLWVGMGQELSLIEQFLKKAEQKYRMPK